MHLVQILIPVYDNEGKPFSRALFEDVRTRLIERFGGLTAFVQSPAVGLWRDTHDGETDRDELILVEVMVETFERDWWSSFRETLEQTFRQQEMVVRAIAIERV